MDPLNCNCQVVFKAGFQCGGFVGISMSLDGVVGFVVGLSGLEKEGTMGFGSEQAESKKYSVRMISDGFNEHLSISAK
jgi:hypothetical protein